MNISIIIPTLNEEEQIETLLKYLNQLEPSLEIIVADGHSTDRTVSLSRPFAKVIFSERGTRKADERRHPTSTG